MKYVNVNTLKEMYKRQPKNKVIGTDGMTKEMYGEHLEDNIDKLIYDMKQFSYRPYPVKIKIANNEIVSELHLNKSFKI